MAGIYADIPEYASQQQAIDRKRKIADMLQQQSLEASPNQIPQRGFAPDTALPNAIAKIAQAFFGAQAAKAADTKQADLGRDYTTKKDNAIQQFKTDFLPEGSQPMPQSNVRGDVMQISRTPEEIAAATPRTSEQKRQAVIGAMTSPYKEVQATGKAFSAYEQQDQARALAAQQKADAAIIENTNRVDRDQKHAELMKSLQDKKLASAEGIAANKVDTKTNAAGIKAEEKQKTKDEAKIGFTGSLDSLEKAYLDLDKLGGITNPDKSSMSNLGAALSSSGAGQVMGGAFGTQEQALRKQISGTIPLLVLDIKNLTGASAQQMNSNVELQNFMKAASDPKSDLKSNLILLKNLREKYVGKAQVAPVSSAQHGETRTLPDGRVMVKTPAGWVQQ